MHRVPLGALPANFPLTAPELAYDKWEDDQLRLDEAAQLAAAKSLANRKRDLLLQYASTQVNGLQDACGLGHYQRSRGPAAQALEYLSRAAQPS